MKKPIKLSRKKSAYSVYVYGALDVRLFPNKRFNVDLKNIEICVSHGLKYYLNSVFIMLKSKQVVRAPTYTNKKILKKTMSKKQFKKKKVCPDRFLCVPLYTFRELATLS